MTECERLLEILADMPEAQKLTEMADYLLAKNVFIAPVTEGDSVYIILFGRVLPFDVISVSLYRKTLIYKAKHGIHLTWVFKEYDFGKTVFLNRESAEKALAERKDESEQRFF